MHIGICTVVKLFLMDVIVFIFPVSFLSSPGFPGLGFGTVLPNDRGWLPGFLRA
jgi:hypothetical protein